MAQSWLLKFLQKLVTFFLVHVLIDRIFLFSYNYIVICFRADMDNLSDEDGRHSKPFRLLVEKDTVFEFPFTPYDTQLLFMAKLYRYIEDERLAVMESPTGTVSSYIILAYIVMVLEN
jgi:hypothetical protein